MSVWEWLAEFDPDYNRARAAYAASVWTPSHPTLPVTIREMVAAAVLAYRGYPTVDAHLRRAVREGATLREVVEAMEVAAIPGGAPCLHYALPYLIKLADDIETGNV
jgi:alkylhydroperoxidase/carboxymuconolactone decarboxylase family protein YurZ